VYTQVEKIRVNERVTRGPDWKWAGWRAVRQFVTSSCSGAMQIKMAVWAVLELSFRLLALAWR
jgi:hypothetical protein